ncbi:hypothetical protein AAHH67_10615 [Niallia circulans]
MYKKFSLMAFLLIVLSFPTFAHATTLNYEYFGTATGTASGFLNLNTNKFDPDEHFTDVTVVGEGKGRVEFYTVVNGTIDSSNPVASGSVPGTVQGARGAQWFKIFSEDGKELHATIAHSTAPHAETIIFGNGGYPDGSSGEEIVEVVVAEEEIKPVPFPTHALYFNVQHGTIIWEKSIK